MSGMVLLCSNHLAVLVETQSQVAGIHKYKADFPNRVILVVVKTRVFLIKMDTQTGQMVVEERVQLLRSQMIDGRGIFQPLIPKRVVIMVAVDRVIIKFRQKRAKSTVVADKIIFA